MGCALVRETLALFQCDRLILCCSVGVVFLAATRESSTLRLGLRSSRFSFISSPLLSDQSDIGLGLHVASSSSPPSTVTPAKRKPHQQTIVPAAKKHGVTGLDGLFEVTVELPLVVRISNLVAEAERFAWYGATGPSQSICTMAR